MARWRDYRDLIILIAVVSECAGYLTSVGSSSRVGNHRLFTENTRNLAGSLAVSTVVCFKGKDVG